MSLFGSGASGQAASANPFGGLNLNTGASDPQAKRKSIFDASTMSQPPAQPATQPSPFGGLGAATTAPTSGGLFNLGGSAKTSAPSFSFGNTTTTAAPTSTGLFGTSTSVPPSNAAPSQPAPNASLFGATTTTQAAPQQTDAQAPTQPRDAGYFSSLLERQKKKPRLHTDKSEPKLSGLNLDLGDLARRAQEIRSRDTKPRGTANDSRAHYLLAGSGIAPGEAYKDFHALGGEDVAPVARNAAQRLAVEESSTYLRDLRTKGREAMLKESMERVYREVDSFIEESLGIDLEEQKLKVMEHFGLVVPEDVASENLGQSKGGAFGRTTRRGKEGPVDGSHGPRSVFGRSAIEKSIIGAPGSGSGASSFFRGEGPSSASGGLPRSQSLRGLREREKAFINKVEQLNKARLQESEVPLLQWFGEVEEKHLGESPRQIIDAYQALREITKESSSAVKERAYATSYLDEHESTGSLELNKKILEGSRIHLEKAFWRELKSLIEKNPREAALGGQPTVINIVRAYIRLRVARRDLAPDGTELQQTEDSSNGTKLDYCWALIFYLLRCGFVKEASEYVEKDPAFNSIGGRFNVYLKEYARSPDRRLPRKLQEFINGDWIQRAKHGGKNVDPYQMACYKIVGRCDLASRSLDNIGQGVEDWLWLQFNIARETDRKEEISGELYGLEQIREAFLEIGEKHFQKNQVEGTSAYGTFFLMQILCGLFEQAVDYLHSFNPVSAVHFAISLAYYGLLRVSDFSVAGNELLTTSTTQQALLNFVPLIAHYTADFRTAMPVAAVEYLSLICLNSDVKPVSLGQVQTDACHECLRELCLETREFAKLLGDIRSDGTRIAGAIEVRAKLIKLDSRVEFLRSITSQSAATADQRGQVSDAVLLYHLCEDYDNVISVLNRTLADAVTLDLGDSPLQLQPLKPRRADGQSESTISALPGGPQSSLSLTQSTSSPVELAKNMVSLYNENAAYHNKISDSNRKVCGALLQLLSARAHLEANPPRYMTALEELNDLDILPLSAGGSIPVIRSAANAFGQLPQLLARCAGISVVWAVRAIGGQRETILRNGRWEAGYGGDADGMKEQLNDMAKDLMVFAGLVKYKLPGRVYDMLTRAGGEVGGF